MTATVRVYVNDRGIDVPAGATALEAARVAGVALDGVQFTDARGLPCDPGEPLAAGAILRAFQPARRGGADPLA